MRTLCAWPLLAFASLSWAEWTLIATTYNPIAYADLATLGRNGDIASMRVLVDFKKPPFDGDNLPYQSLRMLTEYDCVKRQYRFIELASYEGRMATGHSPYRAIEPGHWQRISAVGIQQPLWEKACDKTSAPANGKTTQRK